MTTSQITLVLQAISAGSAEKKAELFDVLQGELRGIAAAHIARERANHTLQATALVNEAWLKLVDQDAVPADCRSHFLSVASQAMRRILVDHARGKGREKRGGGAEQVALENITLAAPDMGDEMDLVALDKALEELATRSERQAKVVEMRFFAGLTSNDVAEALGVSLATVDRDWKFARVWLLSRL